MAKKRDRDGAHRRADRDGFFTIAVMLGQKDIRMAMRYSHLSSDFLAANAKQLDGVFSSLLQLNPAPSDVDRSPIAPEAEIVDGEDG
jgi:hypothetical protein